MSTTLSTEKLLEMYRTMHTIRYFDTRINELYGEGLIHESVHLSIGQEAVATGICAALRPDDYIVSTHRAHAHSIAKGVPLKAIAAEILGKVTGCCRGRGGTMRLTYVEKGVMFSCAIVGSNIPMAVGLGLAAKYRKTDRVSVCFFGDGASNTGSFHEGLNLASLWRLPVIFVCENNQYAISTPIRKSASVERISQRAAAYNMPGVSVDGNDVLAVYDAAVEAVNRARRGEGPTLIECITYRWMGHYTGDPATYRAKEEVEAWMKKCPIKRLEKVLAQRGVSQDQLSQIVEEVKREVEEAIKYALESPEPPLTELTEYIY